MMNGVPMWGICIWRLVFFSFLLSKRWLYEEWEIFIDISELFFWFLRMDGDVFFFSGESVSFSHHSFSLCFFLTISSLLRGELECLIYIKGNRCTARIALLSEFWGISRLSFDWLVEQLTREFKRQSTYDFSIDRLIDWLIGQLVDWLIDWLYWLVFWRNNEVLVFFGTLISHRCSSCSKITWSGIQGTIHFPVSTRKIFWLCSSAFSALRFFNYFLWGRGGGCLQYFQNDFLKM